MPSFDVAVSLKSVRLEEGRSLMKQIRDFFRTLAGFVIAIAIVPALGWFAWLNVDAIEQALARDYHPYVGVAAAFIAAWSTVVFTAFNQNRDSRAKVRKYRAAEESLVKDERIDPGDMVRYHSNYKWHTYGSISFSTLFIIVSVIVTGDSYSIEENVVIGLSIFLLMLSAFVLAAIDLMHTNTLSPLVPDRKRFELVNTSIVLGGFAVVLQIAAVISFVALFSVPASVGGAIAFFLLNVWITRIRAIPREELKEKFGTDCL